ncbi:hypothetical protein AC578_5619 [Pseudocercospora eumusae]|uniref:DUF676 domain-containing protein n=1 Tax=Pseudocercospora eumusae TaxID=321146 RepID=A0A139HSY8_9PEZI|nr:hypothetical protein AC578_5619 [Pseudocercospora eumusae]
MLVIALRRRVALRIPNIACLHTSRAFLEEAKDARVDEVIEDAFAVVKSSYHAPKHAIVLAHGLLGFDELRPVGHFLPGIAYWRGITHALAAKNVEVITAHVPPSGRIEVRAAKLAESIERQANGKAVNIIAFVPQMHWGTITTYTGIFNTDKQAEASTQDTWFATPHRGSSFADYMFKQIGMTNVPKLYKVLEFFGMETGAFRQLTREYMANNYNPRTPDVEGVKYYSYGAAFQPHLTSVFRKSHSVIEPIEGANDGLVSVESSHWGTYKGTLNHVSHLDLINWTNRLRWYFWELTGKKRNFNAIAFYLSIADMLAKEGL